MVQEIRSSLSAMLVQWLAGMKDVWRVMRHRGPSQFQFWLIALMIGIAAGFAALFFRKGINALQAWVYGAPDVDYLHSFAQGLPWYTLVTIAAGGGLVVGIILDRFTPDGAGALGRRCDRRRGAA